MAGDLADGSNDLSAYISPMRNDKNNPNPPQTATEISARRTAAIDCKSMDEVRCEIDRLDRQLVELFAERQGYIEAAGRIKPRADEVRLQWRIDDVVEKVVAKAAEAGLSKRIAEPVWRELIDRCIDHEHEIWQKEHNEEK